MLVRPMSALSWEMHNGGYLDSGYGPGPITKSYLACWPVRRAIDGRVPPVLLVAAGVRWRFRLAARPRLKPAGGEERLCPAHLPGRVSSCRQPLMPPSPCGGAPAGGRTDSRGHDQDQLGRRGSRRTGSVAMPVAARSTIVGPAVRLPPLTPLPVTASCGRRAAGAGHGRWARIRAGRAEPAPAGHMGV